LAQQEGKHFHLPGLSSWKVQKRALFSYGILYDSRVFFFPLCLFSCGKQPRSLTLLCSTLRMSILWIWSFSFPIFIEFHVVSIFSYQHISFT
jgi:hypothetical protein